ncbi:hypothetical protein JFK97_11025 [Chromobacterium phragmitis]|uniref:hypothetical protein n=1 Tax=Chromobacterium amazonense TaxID=1382803 RepID=UPI0021B78752|nr:hypothetical protein [Chromobacterium amazonense]MBM2884920.1 hypothetical protein [Chromobacterium amazonense]MDE1714733.1 hypothetical protein [Chromobacterium amazonense]
MFDYLTSQNLSFLVTPAILGLLAYLVIYFSDKKLFFTPLQIFLMIPIAIGLIAIVPMAHQFILSIPTGSTTIEVASEIDPYKTATLTTGQIECIMFVKAILAAIGMVVGKFLASKID